MEQLLPGTGSAAKEGLSPAASLTLSHPRGPLPSHFVSCLCKTKSLHSNQEVGDLGGRNVWLTQAYARPRVFGPSQTDISGGGGGTSPRPRAWLQRAQGNPQFIGNLTEAGKN